MGRSEGDLGGVLDVGVSSEWVGRVEASETTCDLVEASLQERAMWRETGAEDASPICCAWWLGLLKGSDSGC